jgi:hypothetical protein
MYPVHIYIGQVDMFYFFGFSILLLPTYIKKGLKLVIQIYYHLDLSQVPSLPCYWTTKPTRTNKQPCHITITQTSTPNNYKSVIIYLCCKKYYLVSILMIYQT